MMHSVKMVYSQYVSDILFFIMPLFMCYGIYFDEINGKKEDSRNKNWNQGKNKLFTVSISL